MFFSLSILTLISATGLLLYTQKSLPRRLLSACIALGAGSMLAVSLVHILPEALEATRYAIYAFITGFLLIYLIEEILTPHAHDHSHDDHAHEDPHEHYDHVALVTWIAISLHTLIDGLGIRAGFGISSEVGYAVLIGVAIHQVPVSFSLAAIFRESKFHINTQILLLCIFAFSASIGFLISDALLSDVSEIYTGLITAFAGGSLLYVATADLLPVIHSQNQQKYLTMALFLIGCIGMTLVKWFESLS